MPRASNASRPRWTLPLWLLGLLASLAPAQFGPGAGGADADHPVRISVEPATIDVRPGGVGIVRVILEHEAGWHTYPNTKVGPASITDFLIATDISPTAPDGIEVGRVSWPEPSRIPVSPALGGRPGDTYGVYKGRTVIEVPIRAARDVASGRTFEVSLAVLHQACDDRVCLPPQEDVLAVSVVVSGEPAADPAVGAAPSDGAFGSKAVAPGKDVGGVAAGPAAPPAPGDGAALRLPFGVTIPLAGSGAVLLVLIAAVSALMGLALNLTPCVLPVLPLKIMAISGHASSPGRSAFLGAWTAIGVVSFWVAIGLPLVLLQVRPSWFSGVGWLEAFARDPSQLFSLWPVTLGIGLLIAFMSVGLFGLFELTLPQGVYRFNPAPDSARGSFLFGVMTAVLGLPCFGFVIGGTLPVALPLSWPGVLAVFGGMGVGMALPYFLLSLKPSWAERLPRTGPASTLVKQVMGLLLLAAGAFFIVAGVETLIAEQPAIGEELEWWLVGLFVAAAGLWLAVRIAMISRSAAVRVGVGLPGLLLAVIGIGWAWSVTGKTATELAARDEAIAAAGESGGFIPGVWTAYRPGIIGRAREEGRIVVLDFTADWCINCKVLENAVLKAEPVASRLRSDDIAMVKADLSSRKAPGWTLLRDELGQTGIPLLAVYAPGSADPVWMSNAYTSDQVIAAIELAGSGGAAVAGR